VQAELEDELQKSAAPPTKPPPPISLNEQLLDANREGFSAGWRDVVSDLNPLG